MKFKVIEDIVIDQEGFTGLIIPVKIIPAGTTITLEPVEEAKVKAFVPKKGRKYYVIVIDEKGIYIDWTRNETLNGISMECDLRNFEIGNCFRTKKDAKIAQAKVIELFNSFK